MNHSIRFALRLGAVTLGIGLTLFLLRNYFTDLKLVHPLYWLILLFLYVLSVASASFVNLGVQKYRDKFTVFFFPALIFRFFASVIFILVVILLKLPAMLTFVTNFFVLYLLFQVFEITSLMTNLRTHLEIKGNEDS